MRLFYNCFYDGKECDKVIPKLDDLGFIVEQKLDERLSGYYWHVCSTCNRNYSLSGGCCGILKFE